MSEAKMAKSGAVSRAKAVSQTSQSSSLLAPSCLQRELKSEAVPDASALASRDFSPAIKLLELELEAQNIEGARAALGKLVHILEAQDIRIHRLEAQVRNERVYRYRDMETLREKAAQLARQLIEEHEERFHGVPRQEPTQLSRPKQAIARKKRKATSTPQDGASPPLSLWQ